MSPWLSDLFLRSQTDERLVTLARSGQTRAFTMIVERYRRELLAYARRLDGTRAEDLVQQTFLSAFRALQSDTEVRHLRGWLYQILRHVAARGAPAGASDAALEESDAVVDSAEHAAEQRMLAMSALAAVAELPANQHDALVHTAFHGLSRTEVADLMGVSEGAVRQLVHRARSSLRTAVTAITPLPVARWFAELPGSGGSSLAELAAGAGTASAAGAVVKVGALVAAGVVATGVVSAVSHDKTRPHRHTVAIEARMTGSAAGRSHAGGRASADPPFAGRRASALTSAQTGGRKSSAKRVRPFGGSDGRGSGTGSGSDGSSHSGSDGSSPSGSDGSSQSGSDGSSGSGSSSGSGDGSHHGGGSGSGPDGSGGSGGGTSGSDGGSSGSSDGGTPLGSVSSGSDGGSGTNGSSDGSSSGSGTSGSGTSGSSGSSDGGSPNSGSGSNDLSSTSGSSGGSGAGGSSDTSGG